MKLRHTALLSTLVTVVLAGCGSSSASKSVVSKPLSRQARLITRDGHIGIQATATALAAANATAVAAQVVSLQAERQLRALGHAQQQAQQQSNRVAKIPSAATPTRSAPVAAPTVPARPSGPVAGAPVAAPVAAPISPSRPVFSVVSHSHPVTLSRPVNHVRAWPKPGHLPTVKPAFPPVPSTSFEALQCCRHHEYLKSGELLSKPFVTTGYWQLHVQADCRNVHQSGVPLVSLAAIPVGSRDPITVMRMSATLNAGVTQQQFKTVNGAYYLDLVTVCRGATVQVHGPASHDAVRLFPAGLQSHAIRFATAQGLSAAFAQDKAMMQAYIHQAIRDAAAAASRARARLHAAARAKARARYNAALQVIVRYAGTSADEMKVAEAYIDPTTADYNPQYLDKAAGNLGAATYGLREAGRKLHRLSSRAGDLTARRNVSTAIKQYSAARKDLQTAIADLEANNLDQAGVDLKLAVACLSQGDAALQLARGYLEGVIPAKH